ncbi:MAG: hypothetical protein JKY34_12560 [Kordiimonadaceae bacterium]|nr:hypothetical protein [Kordiimonadaceae bacterium]
MSTVYRGAFATLWITLQANEALGILDADYLEDYFGNDSQVSLYHIASDTHYPVLMLDQPLVTPLIPYDIFKGQMAMASLPDGAYQVRGRCRDVGGNYTILSAVQSPLGGEQVLAMEFNIQPGQGLHFTVQLPFGLIRMGLDMGTLDRPTLPHHLLNRDQPMAELRTVLER